MGTRNWWVPAALVAVLACVYANAARAEDRDDYAQMAMLLRSPLGMSSESVNLAYDDPHVMLRVECARQRLAEMHDLPADLEVVRKRVLKHLNACAEAAEELHRLDQQIPDYKGLAKKTIEATPAAFDAMRRRELTTEERQAVGDFGGKVLVEGINAIINRQKKSTQWEKYRTEYWLAWYAGVDLKDAAKTHYTVGQFGVYGVGIKADFGEKAILADEVIADGPAASGGVRKGDEIVKVGSSPVCELKDGKLVPNKDVYLMLRGKYGTPVKLTVKREGQEKELVLTRTFLVEKGPPMLDLSFTGSWDATFQNNRLDMKNTSGVALTNCTVVVHLEGQLDNVGARSIDHIHYEPYWPNGSQLKAWYVSRRAEGLARGQAVDLVEKVTATVYSDQGRDEIVYDYKGSGQLRKDVEEYVSKADFAVQLRSSTWLSNAGVVLTYKGGPGCMQEPDVEVTLTRGLTQVSKKFASKHRTWWPDEVGNKVLTDEAFNKVDPDGIEIKLTFPGTGYEKELKYDVKR